MKLKLIAINIVLCIAISNCSEPEVQRTSLDAAGLNSYLSARSDFKNFVFLSAHNYSIILPMTVDERNQLSLDINALVEKADAIQIEAFMSNNEIILDKNGYLQNVLTDLKSKFTFSDDDLNSVINNNINIVLSQNDSNAGRIQQLPASTICSIYCAAGQINYENYVTNSLGFSEQQARTVGAAWYMGCVSGCGYGISQ